MNLNKKTEDSLEKVAQFKSGDENGYRNVLPTLEATKNSVKFDHTVDDYDLPLMRIRKEGDSFIDEKTLIKQTTSTEKEKESESVDKKKVVSIGKGKFEHHEFNENTINLNFPFYQEKIKILTENNKKLSLELYAIEKEHVQNCEKSLELKESLMKMIKDMEEQVKDLRSELQDKKQIIDIITKEVELSKESSFNYSQLWKKSERKLAKVKKKAKNFEKQLKRDEYIEFDHANQKDVNVLRVFRRKLKGRITELQLIDKIVKKNIHVCEALEKFNSTQMCCICMENEKNIAFNCGHLCCNICSLKLEQCYACKVFITDRRKIFL